jgi:hypothetical protein
VKIRWRDAVGSAHRQGAFRPLVVHHDLRRSVQLVRWFRCRRHLLFTRPPDRVSALSRPGTRPGTRPVIRDGHLEEAATHPGFPLPFGCRHLPLGHPIPAEELSPPCSRPTGRANTHPDPGGVTVFRPPELRPGWVPPLPRGRWCSPGQVVSLTGTRRFTAASPCTPLQRPTLRGFASRGINQGSHSSPVRSSPRPRPPGWKGPPSGIPPGFAPRRPGAKRRTSRWGQANEHGPGTTRSTSHRVEPPTV